MALTFSQRQGLAELPGQLSLHEISREFRALAWAIIYDSINQNRIGNYLAEQGPWRTIFLHYHVMILHKMADDFDDNAHVQIARIREIIEDTPFNEVFDFLEFVLQHDSCPTIIGRLLPSVFVRTKLAYRIVDATTVVPISNDEQAAAVTEALTKARELEAHGTVAHLKKAATELRKGDWSSSVRESISAVESIASKLSGGKKSLGDALTVLENTDHIHGALKKAFGALYGYTSDQEGVRHALVFEEVSNVDEADALFMLGSCASFVSYLAMKGKSLFNE